nr:MULTISPECIES: hypothetical protein [unclassified Exiguobacterium]
MTVPKLFDAHEFIVVERHFIYVRHVDLFPERIAVLVIFLWIPPDVRLARLQQRELERYGAAALAGGSLYEQSQAFLSWAALYDQAGTEVRSKTLHEQWLAELACPILRIEGDYSTEERIAMVMNALKRDQHQ